jgi:hypothetical protein
MSSAPRLFPNHQNERRPRRARGTHVASYEVMVVGGGIREGLSDMNLVQLSYEHKAPALSFFHWSGHLKKLQRWVERCCGPE